MRCMSLPMVKFFLLTRKALDSNALDVKETSRKRKASVLKMKIGRKKQKVANRPAKEEAKTS